MTVADDMLEAPRNRPGSMTDSQLARLLEKNHAHLIAKADRALERLQTTAYLVAADGTVETWERKD